MMRTKKSLWDKIDFEATSVKISWTRNKNKRIRAALQLKRDVQGTIKINYDNTPVGNGRHRI